MKVYVEVIISGFGGQGVLSSGTLIAQAAIEQQLYTTCFPSYGAEMRGGATDSTVIISSNEIGSPIVFKPNILIALNEISLNKFKSRMTNKDIIIVNSSVPITYQEKENTSGSYFIPATYIADTEIKNIKTANMVIVGSLIRILEMHDISLQSIDKRSFTLKNMLSACEKAFNQKPQFVEINKKAIQTGYNFVKQSIF